METLRKPWPRDPVMCGLIFRFSCYDMSNGLDAFGQYLFRHTEAPHLETAREWANVLRAQNRGFEHLLVGSG